MTLSESFLLGAGLLLTYLATCAESSKILLVPGAVSSHVILLAAIIEPLQKSGHEVHMVMEKWLDVPHGLLDNGVKIQYFVQSESTFAEGRNSRSMNAFEYALQEHSSWEILKHIVGEFVQFTECCKSILGNHGFVESLKNEKYDFVITDGLFRCLVVLPHRLGVPFAILSNAGDYDRHAFALQGGLIAPTIADLEYKDSVNVFDKVKKIIGLKILQHVTNIDANVYSPEAPFGTVPDIADKASLFFLDSSSIFDHRVPLSPNVINVGGLSTKPPKELPNGELKEFLDSADNGFILISFGSIVKRYPEYIADLFMETFRLLPYKVVWKFDRRQLRPKRQVAKHIFLMDWIPQNDILGHPNIKLFITHGGNKGQHEALYNAVPMLGMPIFGDQMYNADRVKGKGLGRRLDLRTFKIADLIDEINEVITNPKYKEAITKASGIFHDDVMTPQQRLVHWVEHVIKYGDEHLMSYTNDLSWFQILMLDVVLVCLLATFVFSLFLFLIARCACRVIFRRCSTKPKQS